MTPHWECDGPPDRRTTDGATPSQTRATAAASTRAGVSAAAGRAAAADTRARHQVKSRREADTAHMAPSDRKISPAPHAGRPLHPKKTPVQNRHVTNPPSRPGDDRRSTGRRPRPCTPPARRPVWAGRRPVRGGDLWPVPGPGAIDRVRRNGEPTPDARRTMQVTDDRRQVDMAAGALNGFLDRLARGRSAEALADRTDGELVGRLRAGPDPVGFAAVVRRHGPMVYRVCRRVLRHEADAEDAFQATFLVLARNLRTLRRPAALAAWLHGVALRTALRARAAAAAHGRAERQVP